MQIRTALLVSILFSLLFFGCISTSGPNWAMTGEKPEEFKAICVFAFKSNKFKDPVIHPQTEALICAELIKKRYRVVDRSKLNETIVELKNQHQDLFDEKSRQKIGELLGVQAMLYVTVSEGRDEQNRISSLSAIGKLILVERNEIIGICYYSESAGPLIFQDCPPLEEFISDFMSGFPRP